MTQFKKVTHKSNMGNVYIGDIVYIPVEIVGIHKNEPMDRIEYRIRTVNMSNDIVLKEVEDEGV